MQSTLDVAQRTRCTYTTRRGTQCSRMAHAGEELCRQHAGRAQARTPTAISEEQQVALCEALELGLSLDRAIVFAGLSRSTVYEWKRRAAAPNASDVYRAFEARIEVARVRWEKTTLENLNQQARNGSVAAGTWLLERLVPERYGKKAVGRTAGQMDMGDLGGAGDNPRAKDNVVPLPVKEAPDW